MVSSTKCLLFLTVYFVFFANFTSSSPKAEANSCTSTEDCQFFIEGSICDSTTCQCTDGITVSSDGTKCLPVVDAYGDACVETVQCSTGLNAGGVCLNSVCTCKDGYHYLKGKCWKSSKLGQACTRTEQCYAAYDFIGFECSAGVCQCRQKYYELAGGCRRIMAAGEDCAVDTDCHCGEAAGKCETRVCSCPGSFAAEHSKVNPIPTPRITQKSAAPSDKCDPGSFPCPTGICSEPCALELGSTCSTANDKCAEGVNYAACIDGLMCGCETPLRSRAVDNRACNKVAQAINGICVDGGQCAIFGDNAMCEQGQCVCSSDSHYDTKTLLCRSSRYVGDSCDTDEDCVTISGGGVACSSGVCACVPGNHQANGKLDCRPDATRVGDKCTEDADCTFLNAVCDATKKQCLCAQHFFADGAGTCVQGLGSTCASSADCSQIANSLCINALCDCSGGFVSSSDFETCLQVTGYDEDCAETKQCDPYLGDLKICSGGKCLCQDGSQFIQSKCFAMKQLGEKCSARAECIPLGGEVEAYMCQNAICTCQYGYQREGNTCVSV